MILFIFLFGVLAYTLYFYHNVRKYPKGPLPLPLIGNLYHLNPNTIHEYVNDIGKEYGHCVTLFLPRPIVFLTHFTTIKEALVTKGDSFNGRSHLPPETYLMKELQTGVLFSDGDVWHEQRRTSLKLMRELGLGKNLMEAQINRSIDEMLDQISGTNSDSTPFDMALPLQLCVANVMNETFFGYHFKYSDTAKFMYFTGIINKHLRITKDNFWVMIIQAWPWTKHLPIIGYKGYKEPIDNISKYHDFIKEEIDKIVQTHDTSMEPTNFVQSYLVEMKKNQNLDMVNLNAIAVDFWLGGMETTYTTLRWALLLLMQNPNIQEKLRAELLSVVGRERRIETRDKASLPYFNATIAEIQRVGNVFSFNILHRCTEDSEIGGKFMPKDALIFAQLYSVFKGDEVFENPTEFRPERFLEEDGKTASKKHLERLIAFGMGKRVCVGEGLARMELFLILGNLLLKYRFEPTEPLDMTAIFGTVLAPRPYKCRVVPF